MPQVNAAELYVSSKPLAKVDAEEVQQTTTSLQFTTLNDDGCRKQFAYRLSNFEIMVITSNYNMLLGRAWLMYTVILNKVFITLAHPFAFQLILTNILCYAAFRVCFLIR